MALVRAVAGAHLASSRLISTGRPLRLKNPKDWDIGWLLGPQPERLFDRRNWEIHRRLSRLVAFVTFSALVLSDMIVFRVWNEQTGDLSPGVLVRQDLQEDLQLKYYTVKAAIFGRPEKKEEDDSPAGQTIDNDE